MVWRPVTFVSDSFSIILLQTENLPDSSKLQTGFRTPIIDVQARREVELLVESRFQFLTKNRTNLGYFTTVASSSFNNQSLVLASNDLALHDEIWANCTNYTVIVCAEITRKRTNEEVISTDEMLLARKDYAMCTFSTAVVGWFARLCWRWHFVKVTWLRMCIALTPCGDSKWPFNCLWTAIVSEPAFGFKKATRCNR